MNQYNRKDASSFLPCRPVDKMRQPSEWCRDGWPFRSPLFVSASSGLSLSLSRRPPFFASDIARQRFRWCCIHWCLCASPSAISSISLSGTKQRESRVSWFVSFVSVLVLFSSHNIGWWWHLLSKSESENCHHSSVSKAVYRITLLKLITSSTTGLFFSLQTSRKA